MLIWLPECVTAGTSTHLIIEEPRHVESFHFGYCVSVSISPITHSSPLSLSAGLSVVSDRNSYLESSVHTIRQQQALRP